MLSLRSSVLVVVVACVVFAATSADAIREPEVHHFETATHKITVRIKKDGAGGAAPAGPDQSTLDDVASAENAAEKDKEKASKEEHAAEEKKEEIKQEEKKEDAKEDEKKEEGELKMEKEEEKIHEEKGEEKAKDGEAKAKIKLEKIEMKDKEKIGEKKAEEKEAVVGKEADIKEAEQKEKAEIDKDKAKEEISEKEAEEDNKEEQKDEQTAEQIPEDEPADEESVAGDDAVAGEESAGDGMVTVPQTGPVGAGSTPQQPDNNGCTENCEADEAKPVEAAGPTGMTEGLGDAEDPNYAPVKDTQTAAEVPPEITVGCGKAGPGGCGGESINPPAAPTAPVSPGQNMVQEAPTPTIPLGGAPYSVMTAPGATVRAVQSANGEHGVVGIAPRFREKLPVGQGDTIHINIKPGAPESKEEKKEEEAAKTADEEAEKGDSSSESGAIGEESGASGAEDPGTAPYQPNYGEAPPPGHYLKAVPLGSDPNALADSAVAQGYDAMLGAGANSPYVGNIRPATPTMMTPNSIVSTMPLSLNNFATDAGAEVHQEPSGGCGCGSCPCQQQDCGCVVCPCPGPAPYPDLIPGFGKAQCSDMSCMSSVDKMKYMAKMSAEKNAQKEKAQRDAERERLHQEMYKHQSNYNAISRMARALRFQYAELKRTHNQLRGQIMAAKTQLGDVKNMATIDFDNIAHEDRVAKLGQVIETKHKSQTKVLSNAHEIQKYEMCVFFHKDPLKCPKPAVIQQNEAVAAAITESTVAKPETKPLPPIDASSSKLKAKDAELKEKEQDLKKEEESVKKEEDEVKKEEQAKK